MRPVFSRRRLVDQDHFRLISRGTLIEESPADEAHPNCAEVSRADSIDSDDAEAGKTVLAKLCAVAKILGDRLASFNADTHRSEIRLDGQSVGDRRRLHSGQRIEALLDFTVQLDPRDAFLAAGAAGACGATILVVGHIDLYREQPARSQSGIGLLQADEALHAQSSPEQP